METVNASNLGMAQPKTNIFSMPLKGRQEAVALARKRNHQRGFARLAIAAITLGIYSYLFFYPQVMEYMQFPTKLLAAQEEVAKYDANLADLEKKRDLHKAAYDEQFKAEQSVVSSVLPSTPDKLGVIRLMENFATNLNTIYPPFELNSLTFNEAKKVDNYTVLPFQTSIQTSRANFDRFLELVKMSGNVDPKSPDHIRLLEISNINLRYRGIDVTGKDMGVEFNVQMKAYSQ
jgi:hypothetical protein